VSGREGEENLQKKGTDFLGRGKKRVYLQKEGVFAVYGKVIGRSAQEKGKHLPRGQTSNFEV